MSDGAQPLGPANAAAGPHKAAPAARGEAEFDRGLSFFDAVYGFAATLLIANIDAPSPETWASLAALVDSHLLLQLFGLALSFAVICTMWRVNVRLMRRLRALDGPTTTMNLVAAGFVVLLPFTTQGISDPATADLPMPTALYALNVAAASLAQTAMFAVARARGLEMRPTSRRENTIGLLGALVTPAYFVLTVPIALLWDSDILKLAWIGLLVVGPVTGRIAGRELRKAHAAVAGESR